LRVYIIIFLILLAYGTFSTIFHNTNLVGNIGKSIGDTNIYLFGYVAYIVLLLLAYPILKIYKTINRAENLEYYLGWILLIISLLTIEYLIFGSHRSGYIAREVFGFLLPYIGKIGLLLFFILTIMLSYIMIIEDKITIKDIKLFSDKITKFIKKISQKQLQKREKKIVENKDYYFIKDALVDRDINDIAKITPILNNKRKIKSKPKLEIIDVSVTSKNDNKTKDIQKNKKILDSIDKGKSSKPKNFKLPSLDFLEKSSQKLTKIDESEIDDKIKQLLNKLKEFKIDGDVVRTYSGPFVTTFEFRPVANVKVSKILNLQDDIAMALKAKTIRILAPIPGMDVVGIEIPNNSLDTIYLRDILDSKVFKESSSPLTLALGKDIVGEPFITDLKKLPHLLIAGTTGSGKSVGINAMILSLLFKNTPDTLKIMLIDPKMLEFSTYNDIPHLLTPVITEPKKAIVALANMVLEMERRYKIMSKCRTKNIDTYNIKAQKEKLELFPFIVIVIDELADLMMNGGKEVEFSIARLAQMARASGIHLIVATQRPSVDVVTGLIKANLPSRMSYKVGQRIDSKVILDTQGAESLLGRGDALFTPPGSNIVRLHAPWNSEDEIEKIVEFLKSQREPQYDDKYLLEDEIDKSITKNNLDSLFEDAKKIVLKDKRSSISYLQRKLQIGYNRSARIIEQLEDMGVLSAVNNKGQREILI